MAIDMLCIAITSRRSLPEICSDQIFGVVVRIRPVAIREKRMRVMAA